jgi:hypothetical protein
MTNSMAKRNRTSASHSGNGSVGNTLMSRRTAFMTAAIATSATPAQAGPSSQ